MKKRIVGIIALAFAAMALLFISALAYNKFPINSHISSTITHDSDFLLHVMPKESSGPAAQFVLRTFASKDELTKEQLSTVYDLIKKCVPDTTVSRDGYESYYQPNGDTIAIQFACKNGENIFFTPTDGAYFDNYPTNGYLLEIDSSYFQEKFEYLYKSVNEFRRNNDETTIHGAPCTINK